MVRVKICGITNNEDIGICARCGADALGFVVEYPVPVPWNLRIEEAGRLMEMVPPFISRVCVVGGDYDKVMETARLLNPDVIQLHGSETLDMTKRLVSGIKSLKIKVIKAVRFSSETGRLASEIEDPIRLCDELKNMGADAIVLDSATGSMPAGTGKRIDWRLAAKIREAVDIPVILAGGLNPENVYDAILQMRPYAVDVISGVEAEKGKKDPDRVKNFIKEVKRYGQDIL